MAAKYLRLPQGVKLPLKSIVCIGRAGPDIQVIHLDNKGELMVLVTGPNPPKTNDTFETSVMLDFLLLQYHTYLEL